MQNNSKGLAIARLVLGISSFFIMASCGDDSKQAIKKMSGYSPIVDKGYAAEAEQYIKDVTGAASMYEQAWGGQTPTLEELKNRGLIDPTYALELNWEIEISGQKIRATSTEEMHGGAGNTVTYNRETSKFSGYGFDYDGD